MPYQHLGKLYNYYHSLIISHYCKKKKKKENDGIVLNFLTALSKEAHESSFKKEQNTEIPPL